MNILRLQGFLQLMIKTVVLKLLQRTDYCEIMIKIWTSPQKNLHTQKIWTKFQSSKTPLPSRLRNTGLKYHIILHCRPLDWLLSAFFNQAWVTWQLEISRTWVRVKEITKMTKRPINIIKEAKLWKAQKRRSWIIYQMMAFLLPLFIFLQNYYVEKNAKEKQS